MTVSAFVLNAQNDFEEKFFIPIAGEAFFINAGYLEFKL